MGSDYQILIFQYEPKILYSNAKWRSFPSKNTHAVVSKVIEETRICYQILGDVLSSLFLSVSVCVCVCVCVCLIYMYTQELKATSLNLTEKM